MVGHRRMKQPPVANVHPVGSVRVVTAWSHTHLFTFGQFFQCIKQFDDREKTNQLICGRTDAMSSQATGSSTTKQTAIEESQLRTRTQGAASTRWPTGGRRALSVRLRGACATSSFPSSPHPSRFFLSFFLLHLHLPLPLSLPLSLFLSLSLPLHPFLFRTFFFRFDSIFYSLLSSQFVFTIVSNSFFKKIISFKWHQTIDGFFSNERHTLVACFGATHDLFTNGTMFRLLPRPPLPPFSKFIGNKYKSSHVCEETSYHSDTCKLSIESKKKIIKNGRFNLPKARDAGQTERVTKQKNPKNRKHKDLFINIFLKYFLESWTRYIWT